jgi:hypothetical protein
VLDGDALNDALEVNKVKLVAEVVSCTLPQKLKASSPPVMVLPKTLVPKLLKGFKMFIVDVAKSNALA